MLREVPGFTESVPGSRANVVLLAMQPGDGMQGARAVPGGEPSRNVQSPFADPLLKKAADP